MNHNFGIGTYTLTDKSCFEIISNALNIGYRMIDTAELYGNGQQIAQAIKSVESNNIHRDDIWITSKIHNRDQRKLNIAAGIDKILKDLDTSHIELILLHSAQKNFKEAWAELIRCQNHFNIAHIGVSNFRIGELEDIIKFTNIKPYLNQIEISPFNQRIQLRSYMAEHNIIAQAYGSLTCGKALDNPILTETKFKTKSDPVTVPDTDTDTEPNSDPNTDSEPKLNSTLNSTLNSAQLLLGWATHYDLKPIPTAHCLEHLKQNYIDLTVSKLDLETVEYLDKIDETIINYKQHADDFVEKFKKK